MRATSILLAGLCVLGGLASDGGAQTISVQAFFEDFDGASGFSDENDFSADPFGLPTGMNLATATVSFSGGGQQNGGFERGISAVTPTMNAFGYSGNLYTGAAGGTQFFDIDLSDLPGHTSFDLNFLMVAGNDSETSDVFEVQAGDSVGTLVALFSQALDDDTEANFAAAPEVTLLDSGTNHLLANNDDDLYQFSFTDIPHTSDTLFLRFLDDLDATDVSNEFIGLENVEVVLNGVLPEIPEPSTFILFGVGLGMIGVAVWRRRRRMQAA